MSVVSQVTLPVNAARVAVEVGAGVAVHPFDTVGVQAMAVGVLALVQDPPGVEVCHRVDAAIAGLPNIIADVRRCLMQMGNASFLFGIGSSSYNTSFRK